jgi:hypothetical protein
MDEPTVNVKYSDYQQLREDLRRLQNENYELAKKLADAQLGSDADVAKLLRDAFHDALTIVQFAVANLDPATVAGWPHEVLVRVADAIEKIPNMDRHKAELPPDLRHFAGIAATFEAFRKERDKHKVVTAAGPEDFGPKTPEAAAAHAAYDAARTNPNPNPNP